MELTIVMPCLNEAETLGTCIKKAMAFLQEQGVEGEVVIGDNGSTDGSQAIAENLGAHVAQIPYRGYGNAIAGAIAISRGKYIIMGDSDDSYDFSKLHDYLEQLRAGNELVMGNRFLGGIKPGAMPWLHRYLGNPVLSYIGRLFFKSTVGDFHCGLRGFTREAYNKMQLQTTGMEFASEMVVKASLFDMKISEVPTVLWKDGRSRPPHLKTWSDGWRHLRFLLMYAPKWLFLIPGVSMMLVGLIVGVRILLGPLSIGEINLDVATLIYMAVLVLIGFQSMLFAVMAKTFAINERLLPPDDNIVRIIRWATLERGLVASTLLIVTGLVGSILAFNHWRAAYFGDLDTAKSLRIIIPSILSILMGAQLLFSSFFFSILQLKRNSPVA